VTPPHVPGIPGARLPEKWVPRVSELERRVALLEQNSTSMRAELQSHSDEEDSQVTIPTDAPPRAKVILGFASGLTPTGRLIIGLAIIAAIVVLVLRGVKLF
jgi:hypothetical protein